MTSLFYIVKVATESVTPLILLDREIATTPVTAFGSY